jgi:hypothetical protein
MYLRQRMDMDAEPCITLITLHILLFDTGGSDRPLTQGLTPKTS